MKYFVFVLLFFGFVVSAIFPESDESTHPLDGASQVKTNRQKFPIRFSYADEEVLQYFEEYVSSLNEEARERMEYFEIWFSRWLRDWSIRRREFPGYISRESEVLILFQCVKKMSPFLKFTKPALDNETNDISMDSKTGRLLMQTVLTSASFYVQLFLVTLFFSAMYVKYKPVARIISCKNIGIVCAVVIPLTMLSWFAKCTEFTNCLTNSCAVLSGLACGSVYLSSRFTRKYRISNLETSMLQE